MTVAVYIRVSTASQNEAGQRREVMKWLTGNGINPSDAMWYTDKESGETLKRPEFEQLQKDIFNGTINTVVVYKLDRISRDMHDGVLVLGEWCKKGIRLVSTSEQMDYSGPIGQMFAAIMFTIAKWETLSRRNRQAAGIAAAKERGVYTGRKPGAVKAGVDPAQAIELRKKGLTHEEVAKVLGVSLRTAVRYSKKSEQLTTIQ